MTHEMRKQAHPFTNVPDRSVGSSGPWLPRLSRAAITTLCVSLSTAVWADTKGFELSDFDGISVAEGIHMQVTSGEAFEVVAESEDARQLEILALEVRRGILHAQMDDGLLSLIWTNGKQVTIRVTMPNLIHAEGSSGANIVADTMNGSALEVAASGGARLQIDDVDGDTMSVDVSSGAEINITGGTCKSLSIDASGGASLDMGKVGCMDADIDASTGAQASVHVDQSITADASSGARVRVYGAHEKVEVESSSGGAVEFP
ncbi:MAG: head GIN domain-containing protein [Alphaproteobacteria bacterium]